MSKKNRNPETEIKVDGETYFWRVQRQPMWSSDAAGWRGLSIALRHHEGEREAVVEFPPAPAPRRGTPLLQPGQVPTALVAKAIASAIGAGWDPLSRGKTVGIVVDQNGE